MALIWWIYHFWAWFWPYFNFVDFRAYFGPFPHVNRVGRCHPVNLKTDLVEVEDKFVVIADPKTPQRIHFLWKFMPVQTNLLLTLFLDDPVELQIYSPSPKLTTNCREQRLTALPPASGNPTGQSQPSASPARLTAHLTLTMPPKVGRCDTKYFHSFEIMMKPIVSYTNTNIHGVPGVRWRYWVLVGSSSSGNPSWVSHRYNRNSWTTKVKNYFF